ncbi:MAG: hypothetical protein KDJ47_13625 [Hyphomicrobiaceae bacterium]|nr:hypothetical protein [Hyphomicrobiaceae bacterium]
MASIARAVAEILLLPSLVAAVAGFIMMSQSLARVVPEQNRHVSYPWASRITLWTFMLGGFNEAAKVAEGVEREEWHRAALGRFLAIAGLGGVFGALLMWKLKDIA